MAANATHNCSLLALVQSVLIRRMPHVCEAVILEQVNTSTLDGEVKVDEVILGGVRRLPMCLWPPAPPHGPQLLVQLLAAPRPAAWFVQLVQWNCPCTANESNFSTYFSINFTIETEAGILAGQSWMKGTASL